MSIWTGTKTEAWAKGAQVGANNERARILRYIHNLINNRNVDSTAKLILEALVELIESDLT